MNSFLNIFKINVTLLLIIAFVLEVFFYFSVDNIYASLCLILGWAVLSSVCLTSNNLKNYPVSFFMILGMAIFQYILPLPLTFFDGRPVTYNLRIPFDTLSHHFLFAVVISITYWVYTFWFKNKNLFRTVLEKTSFYEPPSNSIIWVTSLAALVSAMYDYFMMGIWQQEVVDRDLIFYITTTLAQYIWMPLIILFPKFRNINEKNSKKTFGYVFLYVALVLAVAIVSNWRTVLFSGLFIVIAMFLMGLFFEHYKLNEALRPKKIFLGLICLAVIGGPIMDLAQAMVVVRHERYELSGGDFFKRTLDVYLDKDLLSKLKNEKNEGENLSPVFNFDVDERYLSNSVLNRMVNLKVSDNCLFYAETIGYGNKDMRDEFVRQISALLPNVLLPFFNVTFDEKVTSASYSIGDYLYSLAANSTIGLGTFTISAMPGVGLAAYGYGYFFVVFVIFFVIFLMFDSLFRWKNGKAEFSYLFFVLLTGILNYFNDRHVFVFEYRFIIRTYFETVVLYLLTIVFAKLFLAVVFGGGKPIGERNEV